VVAASDADPGRARRFRFLDRGLRGKAFFTTCPSRCRRRRGPCRSFARKLTFGLTLTAPALMDARMRQRKIPCRPAPGGRRAPSARAQVAASLAGRPTASRASGGVSRLRWGAAGRCRRAVGAASDFTARVPPGETCRPYHGSAGSTTLAGARYDSSPSDGSDLEEDESALAFFFRAWLHTAPTGE